MVVFGDVEFVTNRGLQENELRALEGLPPAPYLDLFDSALKWLAERPDVGVRPRESNIYALKTDVATSRIMWWPTWLMVLGVVALGRGMWIVRRR
jgi:hypothetical protein